MPFAIARPLATRSLGPPTVAAVAAVAAAPAAPAAPNDASATDDPDDPLRALARATVFQHPWQLFLHFRSNPGRYAQSFMPYGAQVSDAAEFWSTFNALAAPSRAFTPPHQMAVGRALVKAFSLFAAGIDPTWEDPVNAAGGELSCRCFLRPELLDEMWQTVALACVGGQLAGLGVVGVRAVDNSLNVPHGTQSKIEVWHSGAADDDAIRASVLALLVEAHPSEAMPVFEPQSHAAKSAMERTYTSSLPRRRRSGPPGLSPGLAGPPGLSPGLAGRCGPAGPPRPAGRLGAPPSAPPGLSLDPAGRSPELAGQSDATAGQSDAPAPTEFALLCAAAT